MKTQTWHTGNYRAKLANAFVRTARSSLAVSEKIILAKGLRYFSRKPCLTEGICRRALVVHGLPKPEYSQLKKQRVMNQAFATSAPPAPMRMPMPITRRKRTVESEPAVKFPPRGTTGPVHISTLLNPILEISRHPDRNRLLAKLFSEE